MENETTKVVTDVVEEVTERAVEKIGAGVIITGFCAVAGAATILYGVGKVAMLGYKKVKGYVDSKKSAADIVDLEDVEDDDVDGESEE